MGITWIQICAFGKEGGIDARKADYAVESLLSGYGRALTSISISMKKMRMGYGSIRTMDITGG